MILTLRGQGLSCVHSEGTECDRNHHLELAPEEPMAVTAPIESEMVIISDEAQTDKASFASTATTQPPRDPAMIFVYLGMLTLLAIIATSAFLAL